MTSYKYFKWLLKWNRKYHNPVWAFIKALKAFGPKPF